MASLSPSKIIHAIHDALDASDVSSVLTSQQRGNPRRFVIKSGRETFELCIYIWTLTHGGGRARPRDEYRIQITGITSPLEVNPNELTVLMGYEPNLGCFAGFDLSKHRTFSARSPSIQIPITVLHNALQNGFSFATKTNDEIAIGIRSDQFFAYCLNAEMLHRQGADANMVTLLTKASAVEEISQDELEEVTSERKRIITEVSRLSRDSSFRRKVTLAYGRRCAVTRAQLRLIDAAHIVPVGVPGSSDEVTNGLCLSPTYHRAFDHGLIYLDESLHMQINAEKEQELIGLRLDGGLKNFKEYLGRQIHLPADKHQWPAIEFIKTANHLRKILS